MVDFVGMAKLAELVHEEDKRFEEQVKKIKLICAQHDEGLILNHELLSAVAEVICG